MLINVSSVTLWSFNLTFRVGDAVEVFSCDTPQRFSQFTRKTDTFTILDHVHSNFENSHAAHVHAKR